MVQQELVSGSYVLGVSKKHVYSDLYKLFYNILTHNSSIEGKWIFPAWPDVDLQDGRSYPILILNAANVPWDNFTRLRRVYLGETTIEINVNNQKQLDDLSSEINHILETNALRLRNEFGIHQLKVTSSGTNHFRRGETQIHIRTLIITYNFIRERSL